MGIDKISIDELKKANIWITYRKEIDSKTGKANKIPTGKTNTPNTWMSYAEAQERCKKQGYAGAGFVTFDGETRSKFADIPPYLADTQLCFIDLDSDTGELDAAQNEILNAFKGKTYIERSVSGKGLHIYSLCDLDKLPPKQGELYGMKKGNIEMYCTSNRFAVFTGNQTQESHEEGYITNQTALILETLKRFFPKKTPIKGDKEKTQGVRKNSSLPAIAANNDNYPTTVEELVELARKGWYGVIFSDLYDNGIVIPYEKMYQTFRKRFPSQSEADDWMCRRLAILSGCNRQLIYDTFSAGALGACEKWRLRDDYAARTINDAIDFVQSLPYRGKTETKPPFIVPDKIDKKTGEILTWKVKATKLKAFICDTEKFIFIRDDVNSAVMCYWYNAQEGYFKQVSEAIILGLIKQKIESYDADLVSMKDVKETYENLKTDLNFHRSEVLNADENLIVFNNGVLNIDTMELMQHSSDYLITHNIPCDFKRELTEKDAPAFMRFMGYFCDGLQDCKSSDEMSAEGRGRFRLLMEWLGLTISNVKGYRTKKSLWLLGAGNTGKSKFLELAAHLVGRENYNTAALDDLEERFGTTKLYNKRLVGAPDMRFINVDELAIFKQITGGDTISIEFKNQTPFTYKYNGVLWFAMNEMPKFGGDQGQHVYERMCFVKCNYVVPSEKRNPLLLDELKAEAPAIAAIAVTYLRDLIADNYKFHETQESFDVIAEYKKENNNVLMFIDECCIKQSDIILGNANNEDAAEFAETQKKHITIRKMYYAYRAWCMENGERYTEKQGTFSKKLKNEFGEPINIGYGFEFSTIALKKEWHRYLSSC